MNTIRSKRSPAPSGDDPRPLPLAKPDGARGDGHEAASAALGRFSADVQAAFAEAALRQRDSLAGAGERLAGLSWRAHAAVGRRAARGLKAAITKCVAEAAADTVTIWTALTERVQADCARFDQAADTNGPPSPGLGGQDPRPRRRARG